MAGLRAYALARLGRHDEARAAATARRSWPRGSARPARAMADHDAGLLALLAGDYERRAELLGRALEGDPPVQRADARLRRAEALARLGRADDADAEIRAATLEPVRAAAPPGRAGGPDDVRPGAGRPRPRRPRAGRAAAARDRAPLAPARGRRDAGREHLASLVDLGRPPVTGVVDPAGELERVTEELRGLEAHAHVR